jgi:uncharacterized protein (TIGR02996 family)
VLHTAFLAEILEHSDDDTPRLVHADWLEEHGDPGRAEFVRLQIELAGTSPTDSSWPPRDRREQQLLAEHAEAWAGPLAALAKGWDGPYDPQRRWTGNRLRFERGWLEGITLEASDLLRHAAELFRQAPSGTCGCTAAIRRV